MAEERQRVRIVVAGRVQGVGFRYFTCRVAQRLGLDGWVKNRGDGQVEVEAEGPIDRLDELQRRLHTGPPLSHVTGLIVSELPLRGDERGFEVTY